MVCAQSLLFPSSIKIPLIPLLSIPAEYTEMAETLQDSFNKAVQRYIVPDESDEEISIEYNNLGAAKKRSRVHSHSKKEVKSNEVR